MSEKNNMYDKMIGFLHIDKNTERVEVEGFWNIDSSGRIVFKIPEKNMSLDLWQDDILDIYKKTLIEKYPDQHELHHIFDEFLKKLIEFRNCEHAKESKETMKFANELLNELAEKRQKEIGE